MDCSKSPIAGSKSCYLSSDFSLQSIRFLHLVDWSIIKQMRRQSNDMIIKYYAMAGAGLVLFAAGYWIADAKADAAWAEREAQYAAAQVAANEATRAQERLWQDKLTKVASDAKIIQQRLQIDSEQLAATVDGLRHTLKVSASKHQSADTSINELRRAGATTELVRRELLGFVITRAEGLAAAYDRGRAAGLTCQAAYNALH